MLAEDDDAIRVAESALAVADELGLDELRVDLLTTVGTAKGSRGDMTGVEDLERAIALTAGRLTPTAWRANNNLSSVLTHRLGEVERSQRLLEDGLRIAERIGDAAQSIWFHGNLAIGTHHLGDLDETVRLADSVIAAAESGFPNRAEVSVRAYRARVRLARDDVTGAAADVERAIDLARAVGGQAMQSVFSNAAFVLLGLGRRTEAATLVDELVEMIKTRGMGAVTPSALPAFAAALVELDREADFADCAARAARPSPWVPAAEAYVAGTYELAADLYAELSVPDEALARLKATEQLAAAGRRAEADAQLQRALAYWRSVGATRYIREGEALFAATA
jgi:hypothetical protein